jgi:hypothetical protein
MGYSRLPNRNQSPNLNSQILFLPRLVAQQLADALILLADDAVPVDERQHRHVRNCRLRMLQKTQNANLIGAVAHWKIGREALDEVRQIGRRAVVDGTLDNLQPLGYEFGLQFHQQPGGVLAAHRW